MNVVLILAGSAVLAAAWLGPLPELAKSWFAAHMAMHVSVVAVAAPLMGAALARMPASQGRAASLLLAPLPASLLEFAVVWAWHVPAFHHLARVSAGAFIAEQASFLAAGLLLWTSSLRAKADGEDVRGTGIVALLLTSMHMILLGTLLTLATRPLYHHASPGAGGALEDQQLGGVLMLFGGGVPYLAGGLYLVWGLLKLPQRETDDVPPVPSGPRRGDLQ